MRASALKERNLYRDIFRGAWEITWRRRELWALGFLASLLMMNGGACEFIIRAVYKISSGDPYVGGAALAQSFMGALFTSDPATQLSVFLSLIIFLAVFALVALIAVSAGGALLSAAAGRTMKKRSSVRNAFGAGAGRVGSLLVTQLVGRTVIFVAFVLAALGVYSSIDGAFGYATAIILFDIFSLVALAVSFLMMMTNAGIMIGGKRWVNAAHDSFGFFKRHWLISIEMIGFIFLLDLFVGALILAALAIVIAPFTLILIALAAVHVPVAITIISVIFGLLGILIVLVGGSMLAVFENAAWALLYTRLAERGAVSKLERLWRSL